MAFWMLTLIQKSFGGGSRAFKSPKPLPPPPPLPRSAPVCTLCTDAYICMCFRRLNNYCMCYLTVAELKAEVEMVKSTMAANIEKVLERGEQLESLEEMANGFSSQAIMFQVNTFKRNR